MEYIDTAVVGPADTSVQQYNCTASGQGHWRTLAMLYWALLTPVYSSTTVQLVAWVIGVH